MKSQKLLIPLIITSLLTTPVYAEEMNEEYQEEIMTMTSALKDMLNEDKENVYQDIKEDVRQNQWDYDLTMDSFREEDVFKDVKYMDMIAAYMTCKNYYNQEGKSFIPLREVPLISYGATEKTIEDYIPVKVPAYEEISEGVYQQKPVGLYITRDAVIDIYITNDEGFFIKNGMESIKLDRQIVKYGQVQMNVMTVEELFDFYGVTANAEYQTRLDRLSRSTGNNQLYQSLGAKTPNLRQILDLASIVDNVSDSTQRQQIAEVATSLVGQVPYLWGGKPTKAGYDNTWWLYNENNEQNGLDCSGFVEWTYMTAGYSSDIYNQLHSTGLILDSDFTQITEDELQMGDVGVSEGIKYNHTGIFLGYKNGEQLWVHCNSTDNTVAITSHSFQKYYSPISEKMSDDEEKDIDIINEMVYSTNNDNNYTENEIYTVAQLIVHEAGGEGLNGWVAVAEVVRNRIESPLYPNTVEEVVYQENQFSYVSKIKSITPSQEIIDIAREVFAGNISILNNPKCLYYRNPEITSNISPNEQVAWGKFPWYMAVGNHAFYLQN